MTIYILDSDPHLAAQYLDDRSLNTMIKDVAQVLCNAHWLFCRITYPEFDATNGAEYKFNTALIPLKEKNIYNGWSQWARECKANYEWLVELGIDLDCEWTFRFGYEPGKLDKHHKLWNVLLWARDNVPDLPSCVGKQRCTPDCTSTRCNWDNETKSLPLVMPNKYQNNVAYDQPFVICYYRNYYLAKLSKWCGKKLMYAWTNRKKPEWLSI